MTSDRNRALVAVPQDPDDDKRAFDLAQALPWGRNRIEYQAFFDLYDLDKGLRILDCAAGPSSFAAEMADLGYHVISTDPLYAHDKIAIARRIVEARPILMAGVRAAEHRFLWDDYGSPEGLEATRMSSMKFFLKDYEEGRLAGRYVPAALPTLPFADKSFDLALVSHLLFTYSAQLDAVFHIESLRELTRVADEVRVFPLLDIEGERSIHLEPVLASLASAGLASEVRDVEYEFQKGGNQMLRIYQPD